MEHRIILNGKVYLKSYNINYAAGCLAALKSLYDNGKIANTSSYKDLIEASEELKHFFVTFCYLRDDEFLDREEMDTISLKELNGRTGIRVKGNGVYHLYNYDSNSFVRGLLNTFYNFDDYYLDYVLPFIYTNNRIFVLVRSQLSFTSGNYLTLDTAEVSADQHPDDDSAPTTVGELVVERTDTEWVGHEEIIARSG